MPALKNNLLLVDDDVELRTLLTAILTRSGYKVRAAEDGFSALAETRIDMPDIVLSDLYMIGMSGFELLSVVRRRFPVVRVIAMSSAFSGEDIPAGVAADSFYQKATSITSLLQILESPSRVQDARSTTQNSTSTPIWIATHPHTAEAGDEVMLPCPECLRIFSHLPENTSTLIREADCGYCLTPVHFAMVETVDPGPPKPAPRPIALAPAPLKPHHPLVRSSDPGLPVRPKLA
jgi:DNA-binding response OmpR family regulator